MTTAPNLFRQRLLAGACALVMGGLTAGARADQSATQVNLGIGQAATGASESVIVHAKRLLLKEKNAPSAVTELGQAQIAATGITGGVTSLLRQAPSVNTYQQGIGNNEPVLSVRGLRGLEVAQTLDGVPMQDLLQGGTGAYLQNNLGGRFDLSQIDNVTIYAGVASPNKNTFGTIGGTIAYDSKRPTNDQYMDVYGTVGSFKTFDEGFVLNSGAFDSPLGTGDNAAKAMVQYHNEQTAGFIDYTPARYQNLEFAFDKPYNDGLSKFSATVIYNTGSGLILSEPVPGPYAAKNGLFANYNPNLLFQSQANDYLSVILKDDHYINDYVNVGLTAFYLNSDSQLTGWGNLAVLTPGNPYVVGVASPFVQNPAGFGYPDYYYGPTGGFFGPGTTGLFYKKGVYYYDPTKYANTPLCPTSYINTDAGGQVENSSCGLNSQTAFTHNDTYGIQPRINILPPDIAGVEQAIALGGLAAKETSPYGPTYLGATEATPQDAANLTGGFDGGTQRTIYQVYAQDKISLLDNTLHLTPGITIEGTDSSARTSEQFYSADPKFPNNLGYYPFKQTKWDRDYLPFFNVAYDLDKIVPPLAGTSLYASYGTSALFAPVSDFTPNTSAGVPFASIVHMYEGGVKYDTSKLLLTADYFYQKVDRDFGFFQGQAGPITGQSVYTNDGQREFKGVEANATYQLTPGLQLFGNISHIRAVYLNSYLASVTVFEDQFGEAVKGPISGIPDWLSTFGAQYNTKSVLMDGDEFSARLTGQYTGQQYTTYDITGLEKNIPLPSGIPTNFINPNTGLPYPAGYIKYLYQAGATLTNPNNKLPAYAIFNLLFDYKMPTPQLPLVKNVKFELNFQNIFNQHFYQYYYNQISPKFCGNFTSGPYAGLSESNYSCGSPFNDGLPGLPFAMTFTVTARF